MPLSCFLQYVCLCLLQCTPGKRDAWLETMESIRIRVFVTVRKEERGRRNSNSLSGKMCFSVTMAFSAHNLSHKALWGMCLWQGTKSIMTYCWTCFYIVSHVYVLILPQPSERTNTQRDCAKKKERWLLFGRPSISVVERLESYCCLLNAPLIWMASVCS